MIVALHGLKKLVGSAVVVQDVLNHHVFKLGAASTSGSLAFHLQMPRTVNGLLEQGAPLLASVCMQWRDAILQREHCLRH